MSYSLQPECEDEQADAGPNDPNPSRETKFSGANGDREIFTFPVELTTRAGMAGSLTRSIHILLSNQNTLLYLIP